MPRVDKHSHFSVTMDNARVSYTYVAPNPKEATGKPKNLCPCALRLKHSLHYEHCKVEQLTLNCSSLFCSFPKPSKL